MNKGTVRVTAHAKINVRLKVSDRTPDGYHYIETIFVRIALADDVTVSASDDGTSLERNAARALAGAWGPAEEDLAMRALFAFAGATGHPPNVAIDVSKEIPIGAGLGGGSADAAAVLIGLNELSARALSESELIDVAATIGADVPFMVSGYPVAIGRGRGEELAPCPALEERPVLLVTPAFSVSTPAAYGWLDADRPNAPARTQLDASAVASWSALAAHAENDLEAPVLARHPAVAEMLDAVVESGAEIARMTGSGSTVFGVFPAGVEPRLKNPRPEWQVRATRTLRSVVPPRMIE